MEILDVARWQFGITTVYHFLMVPLTIGLALLVAIMQTAWHRTGDPRYLAMTKFWGKLMLINFAMGVVTGIVQEFQFGMNWSAYSRFVGDVFGAPLAMEGLVAFFVESTFLGLWIFGWGRISQRLHLASIWAAALATVASAYFILAANSWMQHPVGVEIGPDGDPVLNSIWALLTNSTVLAAFPHTLAGSLAVAGTVLIGVSAWHLARRHRNSPVDDPDRRVWHTSLRWGGWVGLASFAAVAVSGDIQAKLMFEQQPMKMAAAEALCETEEPAGFSIFAIGDLRDPSCDNIVSVTVPALLSFLAEGDFESEVKGIEELIPAYQEQYGSHYPDDPRLGELAGMPIDYVPSLPVTYWGFRLMIGFGSIAAAAAAAALWFTRGGRVPRWRWFAPVALASIATPFLANTFGWIFTEMGRQPFVVVPNPTGVDGVYMFTASAVSAGVSLGEAVFSLVALTLVYAALAVVELFLLIRYARAGVDGVMRPPWEKDDPPDDDPPASADAGDDGQQKGRDQDVLSFAY
ncbi:cytochrome d ubiquinol oxidase subunit I [Actinoalloteichus hoggarensis]|uniref:Cytochrome bd-I ubiquinol oxidase subunit 1 n=1 Tax=Actinoalloteichus hoggarensis TaxID=1470176 RepID=A0A221VW56_9PSEU|nr:cytochrome ubiquinol oxidase subunit I [Actinoalloteichus hoggarensis]ASO17780.1 Cytochrome bd-I ubiquinol oxidase subunit 1 [Actinoalloteichus hoggarensis]MBB5922907.1 cytochrome d ubiquinol oxidase subunit I [Actinoalloteichus hoggarensis]